MKVGILICDHVEDRLREIQGGYDQMYAAMLSPLACESFFVCDGHFPESAAVCDAWLVGGSKYSVYDDLPWIVRLKDFVRQIEEKNQPFVGICFGHQMLSEALGGEVRKAEGGWCLGIHNFKVLEYKSWMIPPQSSIHVSMLCQDQVRRIPDDSEVIAASPQCPVAIYQVGKNMLGIQGHPEFSIEYKAAIIESRRLRFGDSKTDEALESLGKTIHHQVLIQWIIQFIKQDQL